MSTIRVVEASEAWLARWDENIERSINGTLFHLRRFLAYHGDRFAGAERFLLVLHGDSLLAQLPAAIIETGSERHLRSPYGASYGGFAFQRYPSYGDAARIVGALLDYCGAHGVNRVTLTPPIAACAQLSLDVVAFALLHAGFASVNRDVSSLAALESDEVSSRARNTARRAERHGVTVRARAGVQDFWSVVDDTFERHGSTPTHSLAQFRRLATDLPARVYCDVAYHDGAPVAGIGHFVINRRVNSSFYLCQRSDSSELNGLTLCVLQALARAREEGYRWFDFGTSTAAMQPRETIFRFKEQFGRVGQFRETFQWTAT